MSMTMKVKPEIPRMVVYIAIKFEKKKKDLCLFLMVFFFFANVRRQTNEMKEKK